MSLVLRRTYLKAKSSLIPSTNANLGTPSPLIISRTYIDDKSGNMPQFSSSTILIENGFNVQELPMVVKKLKDLSEIEDKPNEEPMVNAHDSVINYQLIQEEFKQCLDLKDVFTLITKCTKITPDIALGAIERIHDIEKNPSPLAIDSSIVNSNLAKGAILDKLIKVVMKTEDTQTILNILSTVSSFMAPFKYKFHDELLLRVIDNKLSIEQLCEFIKFLIMHKNDIKYSDTIDKLWIGFVVRESDINETNITQIFNIVHGLNASKKVILTLLEQKLSDLWSRIKVPAMQDILSCFVTEKYLSLQSCCVIGGWLSLNIHAVDEDALLDIISKLTRLKYTDDQIEKSIEKYMTLKVSKIENPVLVVGVLNFCLQFQIRNERILNSCCTYFMKNWNKVPSNFLKSFIYPCGYLHYDPVNSLQFWEFTEKLLENKFDKLTSDDLSSAVLSFIYVGKYPTRLVNRMLSSEYLSKVNKPDTLKRLQLIDIAMSLECKDYSGPLLPKDQWSTPISQDFRIKNILDKIVGSLTVIAGGNDKFSLGVSVPYLPSDETYFLDVMIHPSGLGSNVFNWKSKTDRNENIALLVHLPDHYCSKNEHLIGPQIMKKRHLKTLGLKVASLKYAMLSQFYTSFNKNGLREYLSNSVHNAEECV